jgi:hypothetical protein
MVACIFEHTQRRSALDDFYRPRLLGAGTPAVEPLSEATLAAATAQLEREGWCVLPARLPAPVAADLAGLAMEGREAIACRSQFRRA